MIEIDLQIANRLGLHARAAAKFVHVANLFKSKITVSKDGTRVDGKSILGLLTLAAPRGAHLRLAVEGEDELQAVDKLKELVLSRFGEES